MRTINKQRLAIVLVLVIFATVSAMSRVTGVQARQPQIPPKVSLSSGPQTETTLGVNLEIDITAVFVEIRCHAGIALVLQQAIIHLKGFPVRFVLWHSTQNQLYIEGLVAANSVLRDSFDKQQLKLRLFSPDNYGSATGSRKVYAGNFWYSKLLTSLSFWQDETIQSPLVITMQSDTLICRPPSDELTMGRTFIGGLSGFYENHETNWSSTVETAHLPDNPSDQPIKAFLNGGFSLRNVSWSIECIKAFGDSQQYGWADDSLYNYCRRKLSSLTTVTEVQAYLFASDNGKTSCFNYAGERRCPFAVHKPWKSQHDGVHEKREPVYLELVAHCPELEQLERLQFAQQGRYCNTSFAGNVTSFECNCSRRPYRSVRVARDAAKVAGP